MEPQEGDYSHMEMEYCLEVAAKLPRIGDAYPISDDYQSHSACVNLRNPYVPDDLGSVPQLSTVGNANDGYWPILEYDELQLVMGCSSTGSSLPNYGNQYGGCTNNFEAVPTYIEPCLFAKVDQQLLCDTALHQQHFQRSTVLFTGEVTVPSPTVSSLDSAIGGSTLCSPVSAIDGNFPYFIDDTHGNMGNSVDDCFGYNDMQQKQPVDSSCTQSMYGTISNSSAGQPNETDVNLQYSSGDVYGSVNGWTVYRDQTNYRNFNNGGRQGVITEEPFSLEKDCCSSGSSSPHLLLTAPIAYYSAAPMTANICGTSNAYESVSCYRKPIAVERKKKVTTKKPAKRYANASSTANPFLAVAAAASAAASSSAMEGNNSADSGDAAMMAEQIRRNAEISWAMSPFRRLEAEQLRQRRGPGGESASLLSSGVRRRPPNIRRKFSLMTSFNLCGTSSSSGSATLSSVGSGVHGSTFVSASRKRRRAEACTCAIVFNDGFGDSTKPQRETTTAQACRKCSPAFASALDIKLPASNLSARRWQSEVWTKIRHSTSVGAGANFAKVVAASGGCGTNAP